MQFNSLNFLLFFFIVIILYYIAPPRYRWALLLFASYYFYMSWKPSYGILLAGITAVNYSAGLRIDKSGDSRSRNLWLITSLICSISPLFFFKYFNFFNNTLFKAVQLFNLHFPVPSLNLILPIGISFFTLQSINYTIDVYRNKRKPERHLGIFALYVAFFPQLLAGPIGRSTSLIPQLYNKSTFDTHRIAQGLQLMLWGFFKKLVIADRLTMLVDKIYNNPSQYDGPALILATYAFAFQIYCDFSGYSDIAIGAAKILGIDLMQNFNAPYQSKSINEFWKRWHISLTSWFKDYIWMVLRWPWYYSISFVFILSGLWHGANWTYVIWGGLNGFYLVFAIWSVEYRKEFCRKIKLTSFPKFYRILRLVITFHLICFSWIFFRANSLSDAFYIIRHLFSNLGGTLANMANPSLIIKSLLSQNIGLTFGELLIALFSIIIMEIVQKIGVKKKWQDVMGTKPIWIRWATIYAVFFAIILFGEFHANHFIYFQF